MTEIGNKKKIEPPKKRETQREEISFSKDRTTQEVRKKSSHQTDGLLRPRTPTSFYKNPESSQPFLYSKKKHPKREEEEEETRRNKKPFFLSFWKAINGGKKRKPAAEEPKGE